MILGNIYEITNETNLRFSTPQVSINKEDSTVIVRTSIYPPPPPSSNLLFLTETLNNFFGLIFLNNLNSLIYICWRSTFTGGFFEFQFCHIN
jgi:hypothetical protein